jgi:tetratricopeptide (TPR) repeat protein
MHDTVRRMAVAAILVLAGLAGACSKDANAYLEAGNKYAEAGKHREAVIEYRNALAKDPSLAAAHERLATSALALGDGATALGAIVRAADLKPDDLDLQVKAGTFLLLAKRFEDARGRAEKVLAKAPNRGDALVLRANALAGLSDFDAAVTQLQDAIQLDPRAALYSNLGSFELARGRKDDAEAAFRRAVELEPRSVNAQLALAQYLWTSGRVSDAERILKVARQLEPANPLANRALAALHVSTGRLDEAEPYFKTLADNSKALGPALDLANYYVATRRPANAIAVLEVAARRPEWWAAAQTRIAALQQSEGKKDEALKTIDAVLARDSKNVPALVTKSRFLIAESKTKDARALIESAVAADARSIDAHYLLGTLQAQAGQFEDAAKSFRRVLDLNPKAAAAQVQLARLELARGAAASSVQLSSDAVKGDPANPIARLLLVRGYLAQRQLDRADTELKSLVQAYPDWAPARVELGRLRLQQGNKAAAREAFERALALNAANVGALSGVTALDAAEHKLDAAKARVDARLAATPASSPVLVLAGRLAIASRDLATAEARLKAAVEADPSNFEAYGLLGQLYLGQRRLDQARQEFEALAAHSPRPVGAQTMVGMILQAQNKTAEAAQQYEKVMQAEPRAAVAANNLAWLYADSGQKLDQALQFAQAAKAELPDVAAVSDTLAFVYLKRRQPDLAIPLAREALDKEPDNPTYHFRLGQAYADSGKTEDARREMAAALKLNPQFPGADEARRVMSAAKVD